MTDEHFIRFIDVYVDKKPVERISLSPGVEPAGCIHLKAKGKSVQVVENCTLHGYLMSEAGL